MKRERGGTVQKERYFRDELHKLFIQYAIIPAVVLAALCVVALMAALVYGKSSSNAAQLSTVSGELEQVITQYQQELEGLGGRYPLFGDTLDAQGRAQVFADFYQVSGRLGYEADIYVLGRQGELLLSNRGEIPAFLSPQPGISWGLLGSMDKQPGQPVVQLLEPWTGADGGIALGIRTTDTHGNTGYVVFLLDRSRFLPALDHGDTQTIIADRFGWVYASNNLNFIGSSNQVTPQLEGAGRYLSFDKQLYLVSQRGVCGGLFRVYVISDIQNIVFSLTSSGVLMITALVLMTLWVLVSSKKVTENKTRDFYCILDSMEGAQNGNLESAIRIDSSNEFRLIADAYNEMIASLKQQMENNQKMVELVATAQNKQLASQFHPHFLYNTLENIRYMCVIEPKVAQRMVYSLSALLRYSMDSSQTQVTLQEDLEHLQNYLTILRYRFNRRFSYKIDVSPQALTQTIPKLLLQPMIENSVKYGFGDQDTLEVELKAYLHQGTLVMICRDDGAGITPETLSGLSHLLAQEENTSRHSGLYNIHRRIRLLYEQPYGVEIRSQEGHGTTLVVTLPAGKEEPQCCES